MKKKIRIGILGCGTIGTGIAKSVTKQLKRYCQLTGIYDCDSSKATRLAKSLKRKTIIKSSFEKLLSDCDFIVEAVNDLNADKLIKSVLKAKKHILVMSVGRLVGHPEIFRLAEQKNCSICIPSGAIAGIDAIKAANLSKIDKITLTTRKPLSGFANSPYLKVKRINLAKIRQDKTIFDGTVENAVKHFPQNINVAATIALSCQTKRKLRIRIITSPKYRVNSHEIEVTGKFGKIVTKTENRVSLENPKTSILAILSGIQTLKNFFDPVKIGT